MLEEDGEWKRSRRENMIGWAGRGVDSRSRCMLEGTGSTWCGLGLELELSVLFVCFVWWVWSGGDGVVAGVRSILEAVRWSFLPLVCCYLPYVAVMAMVLLESGSGWGLLVIVERETERKLCVLIPDRKTQSIWLGSQRYVCVCVCLPTDQKYTVKRVRYPMYDSYPTSSVNEMRLWKISGYEKRRARLMRTDLTK